MSRAALGLLKRSSPLIVALSVSLFVALVSVSASGVRGTDQYWYVADVASLLGGDGNQTNQVFPVVLEGGSPLPRPFVHNIIPVFLPVVPGFFVGAYHGWILTNVVCSLLTAFLIFRTTVLFAPGAHALFAALAYLWLPITFWQTTQPLAEAAIAPLVALAVYAYATAGTSYARWVALTGVAVLLFYSRPTFALFLAAVPVAYLFRSRSLAPCVLAGAVGLAALGVAFGAAQDALLPPYHDFTYVEAINGTAPQGSHNMGHFFTPPSREFDPLVLLPKLRSALSLQFTSTDAAGLLFFWPFNALALALVVLLATRRAPTPVAVAGLFFLVLHVLTVVLYQNQFRYSLLATPPLMVALGILLSRTRRVQAVGSVRAAMAFVVLLLLPPNTALALRSRAEGVEQRSVRDALTETFQDHVPESSPVMVAYDGHHALLLGYVLRPRPVLYVDPGYSAARLATLSKQFDAPWLVARLDSPLPEQVKHQLVQEMPALPPPFDRLGLFRVEADSPQRPRR